MFQQEIKFFKLANNFRKYKRAESKEGQKRAAHYLSQLMGTEKGIFLKIGQVLGSTQQSLEEFKSLTENPVQKLNSLEIKKIIEKTYDSSIETIFKNFEYVGKSASIGQVHKAFLQDGRTVAVKIQYPHIRQTVQQQLRILNLVPFVSKIGPMKKWGIPLDDYKKMIWENMDKELSYSMEIQNQKQYQDIVKNDASVTVADIVDQYSRDNIFVQSWQNGVTIEEVIKSWSVKHKREAGSILLESFLTHFFYHGFLQSDPNDGNFLFRFDDHGNPHVVFLDFGSCSEFPMNFRLAALRLIMGAINNEKLDPLPYLSALGFDQVKLKHIHKSLPSLTEVLFEPFLYQFPYNLNSWELKKRINLILGEFKWWFRSAGSPQFFMLMKAFIGLVNQLSRLDARLNWRDILFKNTLTLLPQAANYQPPAVSIEKYTFDTLAKRLKVSVTENNIAKADISLPIHALIDLESIIDEEVLMKIRERKIDLSSIILKTIRSGCYPGEIFKLSDGNKTVRVWTE